jgi:hypothetical protein
MNKANLPKDSWKFCGENIMIGFEPALPQPHPKNVVFYPFI